VPALLETPRVGGDGYVGSVQCSRTMLMRAVWLVSLLEKPALVSSCASVGAMPTGMVAT
jgi:hypothetical protein